MIFQAFAGYVKTDNAVEMTKIYITRNPCKNTSGGENLITKASSKMLLNKIYF